VKESGSIAVSGRFPPRIFRRVPFEAELRLRWEPDGGEVSARIANISLGGMFVVSGEPRPAGTTFELSFKLPEQPAPVRGRGRVAWVRERDEGPERPPGMGVRFLELTPGSRELIFEVVERRVRGGGSAYDTEGEDDSTIADRRDDTGARPAVPAAPVGAGAEDTLGAAAGPAPQPPAAAPPGARERAAAGREPAGAAAAREAEREPAAWEKVAAAWEVEREAAPPSGAAAWEPGGAAPGREAPGEGAGSALGGFAAPSPGGSAAEAWEFADEPAPPADTPAAAAWEFADAPAAEPAPAPWRPVEMPEPEPRPGYPVVGGAYVGRARGGGRGWLVVGAAAVAVVGLAVAGYLLLAGGEPRTAAGGAPHAVAAVPEAAGDGRETGTGLGGGREAGAPGGEREASAVPTDGEAAAGAAEPPAASSAAATADLEPSAPAAAGAQPAEPPVAAPRVAPAGGGPPAGAPGAAAAPARRVTRITWRREGGATEVEIWGDGRFVPGSYHHSTLGGERPRELIRVTGIGEPFAGGSVEVGTPEVSRVRTGHHVETDPDELHVVVDLAGPGVAASELRADGSRLRLRLEGR
jgi:uncharacterized protein (TIGR02266 family)